MIFSFCSVFLFGAVLTVAYAAPHERLRHFHSLLNSHRKGHGSEDRSSGVDIFGQFPGIQYGLDGFKPFDDSFDVKKAFGQGSDAFGELGKSPASNLDFSSLSKTLGASPVALKTYSLVNDPLRSIGNRDLNDLPSEGLPSALDSLSQAFSNSEAGDSSPPFASDISAQKSSASSDSSSQNSSSSADEHVAKKGRSDSSASTSASSTSSASSSSASGTDSNSALTSSAAISQSTSVSASDISTSSKNC